MRRIPALIPYSHDHQHGLAVALRLRKAAAANDQEAYEDAVDQAHAFATGELAAHLSEEECRLLPDLQALGIVTAAEIARIAREHLELRALTRSLSRTGRDDAAVARFAELLHDHIRWEERELFSGWQDRLDAAEATLAPAPGRSPLTVDESATVAPPETPGSEGLMVGDLNATCVTLAPGASVIAEADREVAIVTTRGSGTLEVMPASADADRIPMQPGTTTIVAAYTERSIAAGDAGLSFSTVHRRRMRVQPRNLDVSPA